MSQKRNSFWNDNKCLSSYEKDINKFYEKKKFDADSDPDSSYETYKCKNS